MTASDEMTCEHFTEMAPAYALAVLDEGERTACTRHLARSGPHRGCRLAVTEARQVTAQLSAAVPARPPSPGLWRAIEAQPTWAAADGAWSKRGASCSMMQKCGMEALPVGYRQEGFLVAPDPVIG